MRVLRNAQAEAENWSTLAICSKCESELEIRASDLVTTYLPDESRASLNAYYPTERKVARCKCAVCSQAIYLEISDIPADVLKYVKSDPGRVG